MAINNVILLSGFRSHEFKCRAMCLRRFRADFCIPERLRLAQDRTERPPRSPSRTHIFRMVKTCRVKSISRPSWTRGNRRPVCSFFPQQLLNAAGQSRPVGNRWSANRDPRATGDWPIPRCRRDSRNRELFAPPDIPIRIHSCLIFLSLFPSFSFSLSCSRASVRTPTSNNSSNKEKHGEKPCQYVDRLFLSSTQNATRAQMSHVSRRVYVQICARGLR